MVGKQRFLQRVFYALLASLLAITTAQAQGTTDEPSVAVARIDFDDTDFGGASPEDWIRVRVELEAQRNPNPESKTPNWVDDIEVTLNLAYQDRDNDREFHCYRSEATILTLEIGERRPIFFYLPWDIVERDNFDREPFGYLVELRVGGEELPITKDNTSRTINKREALEGFRSIMQQNAPNNEGVLRPQYLVYPEREHSQSPTFKRIEEQP